MKKSILLLALSLGVLAGCGGKSSSAEAAKTVKLWSWYGSQADAIDSVLRTVEAKTGLKVIHEKYPESDYARILKTSILAGDGPDIYAIEPGAGDNGITTYIKAARVLDLTSIYDSLKWQDRFYPSGVAQLTHGGKIYSVPLSMDNTNLFYNKKMLADNGITPPTTLAELEAASTKLATKGLFAITLGNRSPWTGMDYFHILAGQLCGDSVQRADRGELSFQHACVDKPLQVLADLSTKKVFAEGANAMSDHEARQLFYLGKAAMWMGGTWSLIDISLNAPKDLDVGVMPFPGIKDSSQRLSGGGVGMNVAINKDTKSVANAIAVLNAFTSDTAQMLYVRLAKATSSNRSANGDPASSEHLKFFNLRQEHTTPRTLLTVDAQDAIAKGIQELLDGKTTPAQVVASIPGAAK